MDQTTIRVLAAALLFGVAPAVAQAQGVAEPHFAVTVQSTMIVLYNVADDTNSTLPTRATDRGLVSEIGGVEFATGAAGINASARESQARPTRRAAS